MDIADSAFWAFVSWEDIANGGILSRTHLSTLCEQELPSALDRNGEEKNRTVDAAKCWVHQYPDNISRLVSKMSYPRG